MITIGYSTRTSNPTLREYFKKTCGIKDVEVIEIINNGEKSLAQAYNQIIDSSSNNILVLCHDDIKLETGWGKKLLKDFEDNPDFSIIGKAGSCYFPESGVYWEKMNQTMVGQVYHHPKGEKKWLNKYSPKLPFLIPVVTIDGLFISFDKTKIKHKFDETIGKFHFYDHGFCIPNYLDSVKIGVTSSFEITHESIGKPNSEFFETRVKFVEKWGNKLPIDLKPHMVYVPKLNLKKIKTNPKTAIIIPNKSNNKLLYDCVESINKNCEGENYNIFIADTGSSEDEKKWIVENILPFGRVTLIEYDYYNFAKINNHVVKNYITEEFEFLLFCNNDIKLLNNVLGGMLNVFREYAKAGTVGCRLHFSDNTVQHNGIFMLYNMKQNKYDVSHLDLKNYFNFKVGVNNNIGNTGGLMMIRKKVFEKIGMFNENYISCFEDVELNISCVLLGLENYTNSDCVAYHYESQTRNLDENNISKLQQDFMNHLLPFTQKNFERIKNKMFFIQ